MPLFSPFVFFHLVDIGVAFFYCLSSGIAIPFLLTLQSYHMLSFWQWIKALRNYYRTYLLTEINQLCAHTAD